MEWRTKIVVFGWCIWMRLYTQTLWFQPIPWSVQWILSGTLHSNSLIPAHTLISTVDTDWDSTLKLSDSSPYPDQYSGYWLGLYTQTLWFQPIPWLVQWIVIGTLHSNSVFSAPPLIDIVDAVFAWDSQSVPQELVRLLINAALVSHSFEGEAFAGAMGPTLLTNQLCTSSCSK